MGKTILVLNMGMKSIRSIIFDSDGNKLASAAVPLETSLSGEFVTQNPDEWWEKALHVMRASIAQAEGPKIDFVTVTTSAACLVYVDRDGNALDPCIMVSDKRAKEESSQMEAFPSFRALQEKEGIVADPYYMLPKAMWVKHHRPAQFERTYKFLAPNDFLIAKLSGQYVTDYINAQKWYANPKSRNYPSELLKEAEIRIEQLPDIVGVGGVCRRNQAGGCGSDRIVS